MPACQDEERTRGASSNVSEVIVERDREVGLASDLRQPKSFKDEGNFLKIM